MHILTVSSLYPNSVMPSFGIFVENRLRHLVESGALTSRVVAPVPWFPRPGPLLPASMLGEYGRWARVPAQERRHGLDIDHPRYLVIPKIGMRLQADALYRCLARHVGKLIDNGLQIDLIDAHYFYPDGAAAVRLGRALGVPVSVTARGTDINFFPKAFPAIGRVIVETAGKADAVIAVCQALKDEMTACGIPAGKIAVLRNGVDLDRFRPLDRAALRRQHGLEGPVILSVGYLIERKGHHLVIEAMSRLPGCRLLIVGEGPERAALERAAERFGVAGRVRFEGAVPPERMPEMYNLADALVLASSREGWANVLLEAMACGTPAVATDVWGTPEVIAAPEAGRLVPRRAAADIAASLGELLAHAPERAATRRYAEAFSWDATTRGQLELFRAMLHHAETRPSRSPPCPAIS